MSPQRTTETPRRTTETKAAFKTTEFVVYLVAVVGVLIASNLVGNTDGQGDPFLADKVWLYVTLFTIGYMISRGLAKVAATTITTLSNVSVRVTTVIGGLATTRLPVPQSPVTNSCTAQRAT